MKLYYVNVTDKSVMYKIYYLIDAQKSDLGW